MRKRMVRAFTLILIGIFLLSGCKKTVGTPEDNPITEEDEEEETKEDESEMLKFGFSAIDMENPYFITLASAIEEVMDENGCEMIVKDPGSDADSQADQIEEMIKEGIQAIFISPVDWEKITPSLQKLKDAGVKVINIDTQVKEMDYVDAYIGSDNKKAGYICGQDLVEKQPEGGKVLILECPTQNSINDRITGFEEAIAAAENGFEVVERADTNGEFEVAMEVTTKILEEHPEIDVIMCGNDQIAVGAKTAVNVLDMKDVLIYGVDGSPDIKKELKKSDNQSAGTAAQSPINMGKRAAEVGIHMLRGEDYEKEIYEDVFMINEENVDMYGVDGWQ